MSATATMSAHTDIPDAHRCHPTLHPAFLALSRLRRRRLDGCIDTCTSLLERNQYDQQAWWIKMRALTLKDHIDDTGTKDVSISSS